MILKILENVSKIKYLRRRIKNFFFLFFIDFFKNFSYNEVDNKLIEGRQNMNFDDMLYYDPAELRRKVESRARKESIERIKKELTKIFIKEINGQFNNNIAEKIVPKVENIVSKEVNDTFYEDTIKETQLFIAHKMIKDNLSKEQVIKYCQLSDEEYETLKKMVFDK